MNQEHFSMSQTRALRLRSLPFALLFHTSVEAFLPFDSGQTVTSTRPLASGVGAQTLLGCTRKSLLRLCGCILSLLLGCLPSLAQHSWEQLLSEMVAPEDEEMLSWEESFEVLAELEQHPIDLNKATRADFEQFPFLSATDVENLCAYVDRYAPLKSLGELAMIPGIDYAKRQLLSCFFFLGQEQSGTQPLNLGRVLKHGRHVLMLTSRVPLNNGKDEEDGYLGYPYKHNFRYQFRYGQRVQAGLLGAQDAGEPFLANKNGAGYDFYSFYVMAHDVGPFQTLVAGKYRAGFGMGLVVNNNFTMGKMGMLASLGRTTADFRAHSSTQAGNYLQGAAATLQLSGRLQLSTFFSWRPVDATLNADGTIATIVKTGYHRTATEMEKKNNCSQMATGIHVGFRQNGFHAGGTVLYTRLSRDLRPRLTPVYRAYYAAGNDFRNMSVDYGYTGGRLSVNGETATGSCHALATVNTVACRLSNEVTLTCLQRFYGKKYYSLFSNSFCEGSSVQDESGFFVGATWQPSLQLKLTAYADAAYFPWPKYQASQASHAWDQFVSIGYTPGSWTFSGRYRLKLRQKDVAGDVAGLRYRKEHRGRLSAGYDDGRWMVKTQADVACVYHSQGSFGWMLTQQAGYSLPQLKVLTSVAYFHTDDYDSRLYTYERGMLYSFNFPSYWGEGIRPTALVSTHVGRHLMLQARYAATCRLDAASGRTTSKKDTPSWTSELDFQLRWSL